MSNNTSNGPLAERVLEFVRVMKDIVDKGREPGFSKEDWAPLEEFVEVNNFLRIGPFHDAMKWPEYVDMLTQWVTTSEGWRPVPVAKSLREAQDAVYYQLEEMVTKGDKEEPFYSMSMYEFNDAKKITGIQVYMQMDAPAQY